MTKFDKIKKIIDRSFLKELVEDESVTDIRFNGTSLWVQYNDRPYEMAKTQPSEDEVKRLVKQIAMQEGKDITDSEPILDTDFDFLRVNGMHDSVSPDGTTMAIRVSRPRLAITSVEEMLPKITYTKEDNEVEQVNRVDINARPVESLLKVLMRAGSNLLISGITGTGKTELQKMLIGFARENDKINLLEDTRDSHMKVLYPERDIMSWQTLTSEDRENKVTMQDLIRASMRNNPDWVIVAETRGEESADMLDGAKTGHSVVTTVHAKNAMLIPSRFIPMIKQSPSYQTISDMVIGKEISDLFRFGIHLESETINGKTVRRIKEIVEYTDFNSRGAEGIHLYQYQEEYNMRTGEYVPKEVMNPLSSETIRELQDKKVYHLLPDIYMGQVEKEGVVM